MKRHVYQNQKQRNEQFKRDLNQCIPRNRKLFWKEVGKVKCGKVENSKGANTRKG